MNVPFAKMHGIGNDFILIDRIAHPQIPVNVIERNAPFLCDRHFGIGSDGILVVETSSRDGIDLVYRMYNPDGSLKEFGVGYRKKTIIPVLYSYCSFFVYIFCTASTVAGFTCRHISIINRSAFVVLD